MVNAMQIYIAKRKKRALNKYRGGFLCVLFFSFDVRWENYKKNYLVVWRSLNWIV